LSTNDDEIALDPEKAGARVIRRSDELAKNEKYCDAVKHAVSHMTTGPQSITIVQCVQPFRKQGILKRICNELENNPQADAVVTVSAGTGSTEWLVRDIESSYECSYRRSGLESFQVQCLQAPWKVGDDLTKVGQTLTYDVFASGRSSCLWEIDNAIVCFRTRNLIGYAAITSMTPLSYLGVNIRGVIQNMHNSNQLVDVNEKEDM
jgi:hypothetical protein